MRGLEHPSVYMLTDIVLGMSAPVNVRLVGAHRKPATWMVRPSTAVAQPCSSRDDATRAEQACILLQPLGGSWHGRARRETLSFRLT